MLGRTRYREGDDLIELVFGAGWTPTGLTALTGGRPGAGGESTRRYADETGPQHRAATQAGDT